MRLDPPARPERPEAIVPMINVVFLLLIFFLMSATLAPPEPLEATPPHSAADGDPGGVPALVIAADGALAFGEARGEDAIAAAATSKERPLRLRADHAAPARRLVETVRALSAAGVTEMRLVTMGRAE